MQPLSRTLPRISAVLLLLPALAGCPQEEPAQKVNELPFAGQEVRIAVPAKFDFRAAWEAPLNEWAAQSGARYSLIDYTPTEGSNPFAESSDASQPTLAIFPIEQAGQLIAADQLAVIP